MNQKQMQKEFCERVGIHPSHLYEYLQTHKPQPRGPRFYAENASLEDALTKIQWKELRAKYSYRCLCCSKAEPEIELVADHVLPKSKGGATTLDNIQPLCRSCNARKHNKFIDYRCLV